MSRESYVSYETAKLLKEKGFDWECRAYWHEDDRELIESQSPCYLRNITNPCWFGNTAPTQQMACKWLRKTHGLWVIPMPCENGECYFEIYKRYGKIWKNDVYDHTEYEDFDEPEYAVEAALQYCLTNLI